MSNNSDCFWFPAGTPAYTTKIDIGRVSILGFLGYRYLENMTVLFLVLPRLGFGRDRNDDCVNRVSTLNFEPLAFVMNHQSFLLVFFRAGSREPPIWGHLR